MEGKMVDINPSRFIVESDFPMPAQVSQRSATVSIPSGSGAGGASYADEYSTDINVGDGAQIARLAIKSSRTGTITVGGNLLQYYGDGTFIAFFQNRGGGVIRCTVLVTSGYDYPPTTTSDNNFTFYISSFKLP